MPASITPNQQPASQQSAAASQQPAATSQQTAKPQPSTTSPQPAVPAQPGATSNIIKPTVNIIQPTKIINPNDPDVRRAQKLLQGSDIQLTSELLEQSEFYDDKTFYDSFSIDLREAEGRCLLQSSFIRIWRVTKLRPELHEHEKRGLGLCFFIQRPRENERFASDFDSACSILRAIGVHVNVVARIHVKVIVLDEDKTYFGSLNALSQNDSGEEMIRWQDRAITQRMIAAHKLLECGPCQDLRSKAEEALRKGSPSAYIAEVFEKRRKLLNLKQKDLADETFLSQAVISKIESGTGWVAPETLYKVAARLGLQMRFVPAFMESRVRTRTRKPSDRPNSQGK